MSFDMITFGSEMYLIKILSSVIKEKFNQEDNDKDDTFTFDLWRTYHFRADLTAPLTGDENLVMLNNILVVC